MGTLYIDRKGIHIKLDGNALAFYANGEREGIVPLVPLKRVVVIGKVTIETSVLNKLADENITVIFLSGRSMKFHGMLHGKLHNNAILRLKQYEKSLYNKNCQNCFAVEFSMGLIHRKLQNQLSVLNTALEQRPDLRLPLFSAIEAIERIVQKLEDLKGSVIGGLSTGAEFILEKLRGYEGSAATAYFGGYTRLFADSLNFKNRNRRPPEDPVNAMLSLCYTLVHFELVREIEVIGLDPTIGFYHRFEYGRESLACDLVEVFRQEVDKFVWELFRERHFTARDFAKDEERPGCYLKKTGRERFYPLYETWAKGKRPLFVQEVKTLAKKILGEGGDEYVGEDIVSE